MSSVIFELKNTYGFFSVFFFLCRAYLYSKEKNIPFYIAYDNWNYHGEKGWEEYFDSKLSVWQGVLPRKRQREYLVCGHKKFPSCIPEYSLEKYKEAISDLFLVKPEILDTRIKIDSESSYKAIYVRRGDKFTETTFTPISDILALCCDSEFSGRPLFVQTDDYSGKPLFVQTDDYSGKPLFVQTDDYSGKPLFVQTDDYSVIETIRTESPEIGKNIFYSVPETRRGCYQDYNFLAFEQNNPYKNSIIPTNFKDKLSVKEEFCELLRGIYTCISASECWVDYSSNVGRFIKLLSPSNVFFYNCPEGCQKKDVPWNRIICPAWGLF
jgi:hypothetical protein